METSVIAPSAWAVGTRRLLLGCMAALVLLMLADKGNNELNPVSIKSAHASSLSASPGYLFLADEFGTKGRLMLCDTTSQKICSYSMVGDKLRLEYVRDFSRDTDIIDGSGEVPGVKSFEGGSGLSSQQAAQYAELVQKWKKEQDEKDSKK